jgi:pimeloyl-ACP methyl ester carboxylesterase
VNPSTIIVAGRQLEAQYLTGEPGYPALVLLHEGLGSIALWKNVPQELVRRTGCPVLAYSRYGNGFSDILQEPRRPSYMHDEALASLPAVLEAFGVDDVLLIGHSDGASIALISAGKIGARLRGIVAEAPHVFVEQLSVESIARAKFAFEAGNLRERMAPYHQDVDRTFYGWNDIWLDAAFRDWDIRDLLAAIDVPMLLIQGSDDEYGTPAQLDAIRNGARNARVDTLLLAQCGHAPHRDRPQMTLDAVAAFVKSVL